MGVNGFRTEIALVSATRTSLCVPVPRQEFSYDPLSLGIRSAFLFRSAHLVYSARGSDTLVSPSVTPFNAGVGTSAT